MKDLCSPGCGSGTCADECGARWNCVIFVGVVFEILVGSDSTVSSLASIDDGEGGVGTMGAAGGVGG